MRVKVYLRIAATSRGFRVAATTQRPSTEPLRSSGYGKQDALPTVALGLILDIPSDAFDVPIVAEVNVPGTALKLLESTEVEVA